MRATEEIQEEFMAAVGNNELSHAWKILSDDSATIDVNMPQPGSGKTAFHIAAEQGDVAICMLLYMKGARIDIPDAEGRTPLHFAAGARKGAMQLVCFLVKAGADAAAQDKSGATPDAYVLPDNPDLYQLLFVAKTDPEQGRKMTSVVRNNSAPETPRADAREIRLMGDKILSGEAKIEKVNKKISRLTNTVSNQKKLQKLEEKKAAIKTEVDEAKAFLEKYGIAAPVRRSWSWLAMFGLN